GAEVVEGGGDAAVVAQLPPDGEGLAQALLRRLEVASVEGRDPEVVQYGADALAVAAAQADRQAPLRAAAPGLQVALGVGDHGDAARGLGERPLVRVGRVVGRHRPLEPAPGL